MISKTLREKLKVREYRQAFVGSQINIGIPFQIRAMLKSRSGWTQATLAKESGMLQPRISSLMTPGKTRPNIDTLRRIANAFDCGLSVRFVPFSQLAREAEAFDPENFKIPPFEADNGFTELIASSATTPNNLTIWDVVEATDPRISGAPPSSTISANQFHQQADQAEWTTSRSQVFRYDLTNSSTENLHVRR